MIVFLTLIWLLLEDIIRRLINGQPAIIVITKDILLLVAYILFLTYFVKNKIQIWKPPFWTFFLVFASFVVINFLFSGNLLVIALGVRSYLWYIPLVFLGYYLFKKKEKLLKFLQLFSCAAIPLFLFAVLQYIFWKVNFPLFHPFINTNQLHSFYLDGVLSLAYRIPSVFGDSQRFAMISLTIFFIALSLYFISQKDSGLNRKLILISTISAYGSIILSASRAAFLGSLVGLFIYYVVCAVWIKKEKYPLIKGFIRYVAVLAVIISTLFISSHLGVMTASFQLSSFTAPEYKLRFKAETTAITTNANLLSKKGSIISSGYQYTSLPLTSDWVKSYSVESGISKIIYEMGLLGLALYCLFFGSVFYYAGKIVYELKGSDLNYLALAVVVMFFLFLFKFVIHYGAGDDAFILIPMWLLGGILFKLPELD